MANLVAAYAVESKPDFLPGAAPETVARTGDFWRLVWSLAATVRIWSEVVSGSAMRTGVLRLSWQLFGMKKWIAYHLIPDYKGPKDWGLAKSG